MERPLSSPSYDGVGFFTIQRPDGKWITFTRIQFECYYKLLKDLKAAEITSRFGVTIQRGIEYERYVEKLLVLLIDSALGETT